MGSPRVPRLVLASASPRRASILDQLGISYHVHAPNVDESTSNHDPPARALRNIARRKLEAVRVRRPVDYILAADTAVFLGARWIGKPRTRTDATRILAALSGRDHQVRSCVAAAAPRGRVYTRVVTTRVRFARLRSSQIRAYVSTGECMGKAGAYAIQGAGAAFVERVRGDASNVVGLPIRATLQVLSKVGFPLPDHLQA